MQVQSAKKSRKWLSYGQLSAGRWFCWSNKGMWWKNSLNRNAMEAQVESQNTCERDGWKYEYLEDVTVLVTQQRIQKHVHTRTHLRWNFYTEYYRPACCFVEMHQGHTRSIGSSLRSPSVTTIHISNSLIRRYSIPLHPSAARSHKKHLFSRWLTYSLGPPKLVMNTLRKW